MTARRRFIGLAAVASGKWNPIGAFLATLLVASPGALQGRLQGSGCPLPHEPLPYVLTILALAGFVGRAQPPAKDGVPYIKE